MHVGPGDRVLLPTYHCTTMVAPVELLGAEPVFYPIDSAGSPRFDWLQQADLRGVKVVLIAHFFGLPQPLSRFRAWCNEHQIALIEDCAHALFGRSDGRPIGSWGDMAISSLTKFLPVPEGGCLVVSGRQPFLGPRRASEQLKAALDILEEGARHGRLHGLNRVVTSTLSSLRRLRRTATSVAEPPTCSPASCKAPSLLDLKVAHSALTSLCRAAALWLPRARIVQRRRQNYAALNDALSNLVGLRPLFPELPPDSVPYVFPLWVDHPDPGYAELRRLRLPVFRWDTLWPGVPSLANDLGPVWAHHVLQLACHQDMSRDDLQRLIDAIHRLYARPMPRPALSTSGAPHPPHPRSTA